jgi:CubicO group peptidase (beta-lactamase class C family)
MILQRSRRIRSRTLLFVTLAMALIGTSTRGAAPHATGDSGPGLEALDHVMLLVLRERKIPGGTLAIAKDGRLVLARGYGLADVAAREAVTPRMLFNLASCTKAFEGVAVLKLVDDGKLNLDVRLTDLVKDIVPRHGRVDPRIHEITVRQLLHHSAGLPRLPTGEKRAGSLLEYAREALSRPLDYTPGTRSVYSNLGFLILRLVIERASGESNEHYVQEHVLSPAGIHDMRLDTTKKGSLQGEVKRYVGGRLHAGGEVPLPGTGCWLASGIDVVRFLTALDESRGTPILSRQAIAEMLSAPAPPLRIRPNGTHNGLGWDVVQRVGEGYVYNKNGGIPGISTFMEHRPDGVDFFVAFNGSSKTEDEGVPGISHADRPPYIPVKRAIEGTNNWPQVDYFAKYR